MKTVVVREYARLTTQLVESRLDQATVTSTAFDYLCNLSASFNKGGASLLQIENRQWLRLDSYVGIIETPCGTLLEILPKHTADNNADAIKNARILLIKMLSVALDLPVRTAEKTDISTFRHPLLEWVMQQFTLSLDHLIKRGIRFDYRRVDEEQRYMRGQLDVVKQMRQPPGKGHLFPIRHDLFLADRPENRLLKTALMRICKLTQQPDTWRLSHELAGLLSEIPNSNDVLNDFREWRSDRLMAHYQPTRPWCELVLGQYMPLSIYGETHGISLLFPMEKLFERYVEVILRKHISSNYRLKSQASSHSLCIHKDKNIFQLKPDFLIQQDSKNILVLDAKWKLISTSDSENKYGLNQNDFYQLFAYGHKHLDGVGELFLIYPKTLSFSSPLPPFDFSPNLRLWVVPIDLVKDEIHWPAQSNMELTDHMAMSS